MPKTAFLFPGQGSQSVGMGHDFYQEYDFVREIFEMAEETTRLNLAKLCFKGPMEDLTATINLQPAVTAVNLACLAVIVKEGVKPDACAGHSLGEYTALCAAGVVSQEDAIKLVHRRAELMHREAMKRQGAMHAILGLPIEKITEIVTTVQAEGVVSVANHNTELQIVVTGEPEAVDKVSALAVEQGGKSVPLKVSGAWHSALIKGAEDEFTEYLYSFAFNPPQSLLVLNVTADVSMDPIEIQGIMARQLCSPVKWYDSMCRLKEEAAEIFVEVGPGQVLTGILKKILPRDYPARIFAVNNMKQLEQFLKEGT
ncbi:MAG: ACP S-malonyltransferase [Desulfobacterales bacterium]|nr:MAG: ACP S-malonyltransferase [Desulfobacterales bacterium]